MTGARLPQFSLASAKSNKISFMAVVRVFYQVDTSASRVIQMGFILNIDEADMCTWEK